MSLRKLHLQSKRIILVLVAALFAFTSVKAQSVSVAITNCAVTTPTEIQFDLTVSNLTANSMQWNACVFRFTHALGILPTTGTNTVTWGYVSGGYSASFSGAATPTYSYTAGTRLLQLSTSNSAYPSNTAAAGCVAPNIPANSTALIGRFRLSLSNSLNKGYVVGQSVGFAYSGTTTGVILFNNCSTSTTNYNTAATRTLTPPCTLTIPCPTITLTPAAGALAGGTTGVSYGPVTVSASGGTAPYAYTILSGALPTGLNLSSSTGDISGTPTVAGNYSFTVQAADATPCNGTAAYSINIVSGCAVTGVSSAPQSPTCFGGTNGSATITLSGTGSTGSGTYSVDGGPGLPFASSPFTVNNLSAGGHNIIATMTTGGCVSNSIPVTITATPQLTGSATTGSVSCNGSTDGSTQVTLSTGPSSTGTYTINDGSTTSGPFAYNASPFTISGLGAGSYTVVATSTASCVSSNIAVTINNVAALTGTASAPQSPTCFGGSNGSATITLSASTSGTYSVDGGAPQNYNSNPFTVSGLTGTNHTVVATSAAGCVSNLIGVNIAPTPQITGNVNSTSPTTCGAGGTGSANITLSNNPSNTGTYTVDGNPGGSFTTNPFTASGLTGGSHTIVVTIGGCASGPIPVTIGGSSAFSASYVKRNVSACNNTNDGSITVTLTGSGPNHYVWSGGYPGFAPGDVASVTNLPYGYYTVTASNDCGSQTFSNIHVEQAYYVYITNSGSSSSACGNTGSIVIYGSAGVSPYTYANVAGADQPVPAPGAFQASNTFSNLAAGTYSSFVKDAAGCVSQKNITLGSAAPVSVTTYVRPATSCSADGVIEVYRTGGTPSYTYALQSGSGPIGAYQPSNTFTGLAAGSYTAWVKDAAGCTGSAAATVTQGAALSVSSVKADRSSCVQDGQAKINVSGGTAPYTYSFNGSPYTSNNLYTGLDAGSYAYGVIDSKGCTGSGNVTIGTNNIVVTATPTASSTCTSNNGKIQIFRTGGVGPYTYSLDGNTYQTSQLFQNLPPGTYTAFVKDSKTCTASQGGIVVGPNGCTPPKIAGNNNLDVKSIEVATTTKVVAATTRVSAYPNPSNNEFTLQLSGYDSKVKVSITVTDILGRKVYQTEGTGKSQYSFGTSFINGMYNVQVTQGTNNKSLKLVKE